MAKVAKSALDAGVDAELVEVARVRAYGELVIRVIEAVLADPGFGTDDVRQLVGRHLRELEVGG